MKNRRILFVVLSVLVIASFALTACQPAATEAPAPTEVPPTKVPPTEVPPTAVPPTEVPPTEEPAIGSAEHPIKVLFVPSVDANAIVSGGEIMADALKEATGLEFEVSVPTSYAATIEEMCASPSDTMGFIPAFGYILANQLCGVDVAYKAVRYGWGVYWAEIIVARDSDIQSLADLDGKSWGYGDPGSTSGYLVPLAMLADAGITPSEEVETGGHPQSVKAVYNGEVDFATVFFSPFVMAEGKEPWKIGDPADVPDDVVASCAVNEDKEIWCGDYQIKDARANIAEEAPDVIQKVRVLELSPEIPNDTLSFGPEFPADVRADIGVALEAFAKTDAWKSSIGAKEFYNWTGIEPATDEEYDFVRKIVQAAGITMESLGK